MNYKSITQLLDSIKNMRKQKKLIRIIQTFDLLKVF